MNYQGYRKLIVYTKARNLVFLSYKLTKYFPKEEVYVLTPQMRRAAISVVANIVEGYVKSRKEFVRYLNISIGSITELWLYFDIALELNYINKSDYSDVEILVLEVKKLLYSYQKTLKGASE